MGEVGGQDAERLFRRRFDNAPIGVAVTALDGSWLRFNKALVAMLGYSSDELQSTSLAALTHVGHIEETNECIRRVLAGEDDGCAYETQLRTKDGGCIWAHVTTSIEPSGGHLFTYVLDITKQKLAESKLVASEKQYRRLFESAKDGILILDADTGRVIDANPFMTAMTGYERERFIGKQLWEIGPFYDSAASKAQFAELLAKDYIRYEDLPLKTRSGGKVEVEFVSNTYLVDDRKVIQCNVRDITARKRTEDELRMRERAIEAVQHGIVITDAYLEDNPVIYASPAFTTLTGYEAKEVIGRNCRFLQGPETDQTAIAILRDAIHEERACAVELLNVRKDGTPFWNSVAVSPIKDADGRVTNFVGVQTDVTARRHLQSQFLQAQKMDAVGRLAGGIAHDFNNLLSVILSYAEIVIGDFKPDEAARADVEEIRTAALRAASLTRQLLAFSRHQVLETKVLNLNDTVGGMEKMLGRLLGADIAVTVSLDPDLGNAKADPGQVEQIIMNLAVNARDAMADGGNLTIETANAELDGDYARQHHEVHAGSYVMLTVRDGGTGMDKETLARIFEPFFTTKEQGKGTGLGLATVFGIVKQSSGHLVVTSELGKGTTFKVYFPRVAAIAETNAVALAAADIDHGGATILLVEDEDQVRVVTRNILQRRGYVVLDAANGCDAIAICEEHAGKIDLLLTDVVLPQMSGRQLAERLSPVRQGMKVLYMSGYTDDAIFKHGLATGVAFLQKPLTPTSLLQKVREVLRVEHVQRAPETTHASESHHYRT